MSYSSRGKYLIFCFLFKLLLYVRPFKSPLYFYFLFFIWYFSLFREFPQCLKLLLKFYVGNYSFNFEEFWLPSMIGSIIFLNLSEDINYFSVVLFCLHDLYFLINFGVFISCWKCSLVVWCSLLISLCLRIRH